jgi:hypothetical protein
MESFLYLAAGLIIGAVGAIVVQAASDSKYGSKSSTYILADPFNGRRVLPKKVYLFHSGEHTFYNENEDPATILFTGKRKVKDPFGGSGAHTVPDGTPRDPGKLSLKAVIEPKWYDLFGAYWKFTVTIGGTKLDPGVSIRK